MGAVSFSLDESLIRLFVSSLATEVFVETGTFEGESLEIAGRHIDECHSVELSREYFEAARQRFADRAGIHLQHGNSPDFLRALAPRLARRRVLYWLDAHWCVAENTAGEDSQSPLLAELAAIGRLGPDSVLCIDDARLFLCPPPRPHRYSDWPDLNELLPAMQDCGPGHRLMVFNDVIILYPGSVDETLKRHAFEHGVDWLHLANLVLRAPPPAPRRRGFWRRLFRRGARQRPQPGS